MAGFDSNELAYVDFATEGKVDLQYPVSWDQVRDAVTQVVFADEAKIRYLAEQLQDGLIDVDEFLEQIESDFTASGRNLAACGLGKLHPDVFFDDDPTPEPLTPAEEKIVQAVLAPVLEVLAAFKDSLKSGKLKVDQHLADRIAHFSCTGRAVFEEARRHLMMSHGATLECRVLPENGCCFSCIELAELGWQPIGTLSRIANCSCSTTCRCTMEFAKDDGVEFGIISAVANIARTKGWLGNASVDEHSEGEWWRMQPRDDHGRWTTGGAGGAEETLPHVGGDFIAYGEGGYTRNSKANKNAVATYDKVDTSFPAGTNQDDIAIGGKNLYLHVDANGFVDHGPAKYLGKGIHDVAREMPRSNVLTATGLTGKPTDVPKADHVRENFMRTAIAEKKALHESTAKAFSQSKISLEDAGKVDKQVDDGIKTVVQNATNDRPTETVMGPEKLQSAEIWKSMNGLAPIQQIVDLSHQAASRRGESTSDLPIKIQGSGVLVHGGLVNHTTVQQMRDGNIDPNSRLAQADSHLEKALAESKRGQQKGISAKDMHKALEGASHLTDTEADHLSSKHKINVSQGAVYIDSSRPKSVNKAGIDGLMGGLRDRLEHTAGTASLAVRAREQGVPQKTLLPHLQKELEARDAESANTILSKAAYAKHHEHMGELEGEFHQHRGDIFKDQRENMRKGDVKRVASALELADQFHATKPLRPEHANYIADTLHKKLSKAQAIELAGQRSIALPVKNPSKKGAIDAIVSKYRSGSPGKVGMSCDELLVEFGGPTTYFAAVDHLRQLGFSETIRDLIMSPVEFLECEDNEEILCNRVAFDEMSMKVQSLLFPVDEYTEADVHAWCHEHDYNHGKVHTTDNFHRVRQFDPDACKGEPRTIQFKGAKGVKAVVCLMPKNVNNSVRLDDELLWVDDEAWFSDNIVSVLLEDGCDDAEILDILESLPSVGNPSFSKDELEIPEEGLTARINGKKVKLNANGDIEPGQPGIRTFLLHRPECFAVFHNDEHDPKSGRFAKKGEGGGAKDKEGTEPGKKEGEEEEGGKTKGKVLREKLKGVVGKAAEKAGKTVLAQTAVQGIKQGYRKALGKGDTKEERQQHRHERNQKYRAFVTARMKAIEDKIAKGAGTWKDRAAVAIYKTKLWAAKQAGKLIKEGDKKVNVKGDRYRLNKVMAQVGKAAGAVYKGFKVGKAILGEARKNYQRQLDSKYGKMSPAMHRLTTLIHTAATLNGIAGRIGVLAGAGSVIAGVATGSVGVAGIAGAAGTLIGGALAIQYLAGHPSRKIFWSGAVQASSFYLAKAGSALAKGKIGEAAVVAARGVSKVGGKLARGAVSAAGKAIGLTSIKKGLGKAATAIAHKLDAMEEGGPDKATKDLINRTTPGAKLSWDDDFLVGFADDDIPDNIDMDDVWKMAHKSANDALDQYAKWLGEQRETIEPALDAFDKAGETNGLEEPMKEMQSAANEAHFGKADDDDDEGEEPDEDDDDEEDDDDTDEDDEDDDAECSATPTLFPFALAQWTEDESPVQREESLLPIRRAAQSRAEFLAVPYSQTEEPIQKAADWLIQETASRLNAVFGASQASDLLAVMSLNEIPLGCPALVAPILAASKLIPELNLQQPENPVLNCVLPAEGIIDLGARLGDYLLGRWANVEHDADPEVEQVLGVAPKLYKPHVVTFAIDGAQYSYDKAVDTLLARGWADETVLGYLANQEVEFRKKTTWTGPETGKRGGQYWTSSSGTKTYKDPTGGKGDAGGDDGGDKSAGDKTVTPSDQPVTPPSTDKPQGVVAENKRQGVQVVKDDRGELHTNVKASPEAVQKLAVGLKHAINEARLYKDAKSGGPVDLGLFTKLVKEAQPKAKLGDIYSALQQMHNTREVQLGSLDRNSDVGSPKYPLAAGAKDKETGTLWDHGRPQHFISLGSQDADKMIANASKK